MDSFTSKDLAENKYLTFVLGQLTEGVAVTPAIKELSPSEYVGHLYHPGKDDPKAWRPGNDFANEYTALRSIWKNFATLFDKAKADSNGYSRKLTLKYAVVELRSFLDAMPRLNGLIAKLPPHDGALPRKLICLTAEERDGVSAKFKLLNQAKNKTLNSLTKLRNNVGAHMSQTVLRGTMHKPSAAALTWDEVESLWQQLESRLFIDIAHAVDAWLAKVQHLPVFEYYRFDSETRIRCFVPCVGRVTEHELQLTALSPSLIKQIEVIDRTHIVGSTIVFRREPVRFKVRWPTEMLKEFPFLGEAGITLPETEPPPPTGPPPS